MSLSISLEANRRTRRGPICTVCTLIAGLSADDVTALQKAFDDPAFPSSGITRALKAEGHELSVNTLNRHRKKECLR